MLHNLISSCKVKEMEWKERYQELSQERLQIQKELELQRLMFELAEAKR